MSDFSELRKLGRDLAEAGARAVPLASKAIRKTALELEADAKTICPVDTGFLRSSISTDVAGLSAVIGPTADYGGYVEYGTSRMGPQPYMGPAFDRRAPQLVDALDQIADRLL